MWAAWARGEISDAVAQSAAEAEHARRQAPPAAARRHVGSRPRSSASLERRRRWTSSGWLTPQIAARFTMAEAAVLAVIAEQVAKHGRCCFALAHLGALAGVSRSTVKSAIRQAAALGLLSVEHRPTRPWRYDTNILRVTLAEVRPWQNPPFGAATRFGC